MSPFLPGHACFVDCLFGGNGYNFKAPADAYGDALLAGIGSARVLLPDSLQRTVSKVFPETEFAPSTPSGSFARTALAEALSLANWADGVLLAGDFGKNSETAIFLESFIEKYKGTLVIAGDTNEYCISTETCNCVGRDNTAMILSFKQLQHLVTSLRLPTAVTSDMGLVPLIELLHGVTKDNLASLITEYEDHVLIGSSGQVTSTSPMSLEQASAAGFATWLTQNPSKPLAALTSSICE